MGGFVAILCLSWMVVTGKGLETLEQSYSRSYLGDTFDPTAPALTTEEIARWIESGSFNSLEDLLRQIKAREPEMFKYPVLVHHSRSLQSATYENPRTILISKNGRLIISFNGSSSQNGGDRIEVIEYNTQQSKFEFSEVNYSKEKPQFRSNPPECANCHLSPSGNKNNLRPIWDHYHGWPRTYGSSDIERPDTKGPNPEFSGFQAFKSKAMNHPRYSLLELSEFNIVRSMAKPERKQFVEPHSEDLKRASEMYSDVTVTASDNNDRFTEALFYWNRHRIVQNILRSPESKKLIPLLQKAFSINGRHTFDEGMRKSTAYQTYSSELQRNAGDAIDRINEQHIFFGNTHEYFEHVPKESSTTYESVFGYLLFSFNIDLFDFHLNNDVMNPRFQGAASNLNNLKDFIPPDSSWSEGYDTDVTDEIRKLDLSTMTTSSHPPLKQMPAKDLLIYSCLGCHQTGTDRSPLVIHFEDEVLFKKQLTENATLKAEIIKKINKHSMPYGYPSFHPIQQSSVETYLNSLVANPNQCSNKSSNIMDQILDSIK